MRTEVLVSNLAVLLVFASAPFMVATAAPIAPEFQTPEEVLRQQQGTYVGWRCWHWANKCARCPEGYSMEGGLEDNSVRCESKSVLPEWVNREELLRQKPVPHAGWQCWKQTSKCARCPAGYYLTEAGRGFSVRCERRGTTPEKRSRIVTVSGEVMIQRRGEGSFLATEGTYLAPGDIVTTDFDSFLRIALEFRDPDFPGIVIPEFVTIGENSEVHIEALEYYSGEKQQEERGIIELIKGVIRSWSHGWRTRSIFSVKAGTTLCGRRGSDVLVCHDPDAKKVNAYVLEGHMDVSNTETGETKSLTDNQKLVVENGILGDIQSLSENERDILVVGKKVTCDFGTTSAVLPDVVGLTASEAKKKLTAAGFVMKPLPGVAAPSEAEVGKVQNQTPEPGKRMEGGSQVSITIYGPSVAKPIRQEFKTIVIPDVNGLTANQAKQRISDAGLKPAFRPGATASTKNLEGVVERQDPAPGMNAGSGAEIALYIYGPYVAQTHIPAQEQRTKVEAGVPDNLCPASLTLQNNSGSWRTEDYSPGTVVYLKEHDALNRTTNYGDLRREEKLCFYTTGQGDSGSLGFTIYWVQGNSNADFHHYCKEDTEFYTFTVPSIDGSPSFEAVDKTSFSLFSRTKVVRVRAAWAIFDKKQVENYGKEIIRKLEPFSIPCINSQNEKNSGKTESLRKTDTTDRNKPGGIGKSETRTGGSICEWVKNPGGTFGEGEWDGKSWVCDCADDPAADPSRCAGLPKR